MCAPLAFEAIGIFWEPYLSFYLVVLDADMFERGMPWGGVCAWGFLCGGRWGEVGGGHGGGHGGRGCDMGGLSCSVLGVLLLGGVHFL